ncbi:hypothetical protein NC652_006881 [Populus alba x Populus x berolinensis]|nr:hypothetical protein NC652_006881 [Populus alba x Populus x berolinensis]
MDQKQELKGDAQMPARHNTTGQGKGQEVSSEIGGSLMKMVSFGVCKGCKNWFALQEGCD